MIGRRLAGLALAAAAAGVAAQSSSVAAGTAPSAVSTVSQPAAPAPVVAGGAVLGVAEGRRIYTSFCVRCHGINLVTSSSAHFDLRTFPKDDKERFVRSVSKGLRAMPAWEGSLKPEQIDAIWAYVGSVNGWGAGESPK